MLQTINTGLLCSPASNSILQLAGVSHTAWIVRTGPSEEPTVTDLSSVNNPIATQPTIIYQKEHKQSLVTSSSMYELQYVPEV